MRFNSIERVTGRLGLKSSFLIMIMMCSHRVALSSDDVILCSIADDIAKRSYERIISSVEQKESAFASIHSMSFWDIYEFSKHCEHVKLMADELEINGFEKNHTKVHYPILKNEYLKLPTYCLNGGALNCGVFISEPPKANLTGMEDPDEPTAPVWRYLDRGSDSTNNGQTYEWKNFPSYPITLPSDTQKNIE